MYVYVVKCRVVIFYTNGSDFKKDRQLAEEIQILQISPFKWTWHIIKYDIFDRLITKKVVMQAAKIVIFVTYKF